MDQKLKIKVIDCIGRVYEKSENCKLESDFLSKSEEELAVISEYFNTSQIESFFISIIFAYNCKGESVSFGEFQKHFDCNPMKVMGYFEVLEQLFHKGYLTVNGNRKRSAVDNEYHMEEKIIDSVLRNKALPELTQKKDMSVFDVLEKLNELGTQVDNDEIMQYELLHQTHEMLVTHTQFPLVNYVLNLHLKTTDVYVYLHLVWRTMTGTESVYFEHILEQIFSDYPARYAYLQSYHSDENELIKNNLVELTESRFLNDCQIKLTEKSIKIVEGYGIKLLNANFKRDNVFSPDEIVRKKLLFSESRQSQISVLESLLNEQKFGETQKKLAEKGLPKGVTVLLYGAAGTGKTEIVKQLAKATNRMLMKVEISQSKSMWFGESEKKIKKIFTDYKSFAEDCEQTPILLFNEADAILSKRKDAGSSEVSQTENAIQNILLEELENFEGILMATTNIANNLDTAFERRFLFKIQFPKPEIEVRAAIWQSRLPDLKPEECIVLAENFQFSGGQIENVVRKKEIHEIVHESTISFDKILSFCKEEVISGEVAKVIGFKSSIAC